MKTTEPFSLLLQDRAPRSPGWGRPGGAGLSRRVHAHRCMAGPPRPPGGGGWGHPRAQPAAQAQPDRSCFWIFPLLSLQSGGRAGQGSCPHPFLAGHQEESRSPRPWQGLKRRELSRTDERGRGGSGRRRREGASPINSDSARAAPVRVSTCLELGERNQEITENWETNISESALRPGCLMNT